MNSAAVTNAGTLISKFDYLFRSAVWLMVSLAIVFIVWHALQFIREAGGDERKKHQNAILWGIVGLAVILSIWGLVAILSNTFNVGNVEGQNEAARNINKLIIPRSSFQSGGGSNPTPAPGPGTGTGSNPPGPGTGTGSNPPGPGTGTGSN